MFANASIIDYLTYGVIYGDIVDDDDDDDADSLHCSHHARLIVLLFYFLSLWEGCFFLLLTFVC